MGVWTSGAEAFIRCCHTPLPVLPRLSIWMESDITMNGVRVRFAPSPTGSPHIGSIRTALYDWLFARHTGGKFILRIEDTDRSRYVPGSMEEILESLRWLGTLWDEGPEVGGPCGPYLQSERLDIYRDHARQLLDSGHAYYCFCTPERLEQMRLEQEARKQPTGYDRRCLSLSPQETARMLEEGVPAVIRFKVPQEGTTSFHDIVRGEISFENRLLDDFVIIKSDGYPTYQFANVVDDHLMGITHVIRGEEWISSTPKHILEYQAFGWEPPKFAHAPLILSPERTKLGKRHGAASALEYRDRGFLPEAVINFITLLGWSSGDENEILSVEELIEKFTLEGIVNHPVVFDIQKLEWMNGVYIRKADLDRLTKLCIPYLQRAGLLPATLTPDDLAYTRKVIALEQERLKVLSEITELADFFFVDEPPYDQKGMDKWLRRENSEHLLRAVIKRLQDVPDWTRESIETAVRQAGDELGLSGGQVIHPVRMAVTGRMVGPGLFETMEVLGKERVLSRLIRTLREISDVQVD